MKEANSIMFIVAGILWSIELIPQIRKTMRLKHVKDISGVYLSLYFVGYGAFLLGCANTLNWMLFCCNLTPFLFSAVLLFLMYRYRNNQEECHDKKNK